MNTLPLIALVGRTNVGKSTLFNSLLGFKRSLVDNYDGLTRDCLIEPLVLDQVQVMIVDTGGLDRKHSDDPIDKIFMQHTWDFLHQVDRCLYVLDSAVGLLEGDKHLIQQLMAHNKAITFVWNKADLCLNPKTFEEVRRFTQEPFFLTSMQDQQGIAELKEFLQQIAEATILEPQPHLHESFGFFGRPNVGKSSLSNALLKNRSFLVSEHAGTTRDFASATLTVGDKTLRLVDTAGIMPNSHKHPAMLERMTYYRTLVALKQVSVAVLVIDAEVGLTAQDQKILTLLEQYRRGLVIVCNKWDLLDDGQKKMRQEHLTYHLKAFAYCPMILASAKTKMNLGQLLQSVLAVMSSFIKTISTGQVNKYLEIILKNHQPPLSGKYRIKLRYAHVVDTNPLTLMIHGNQLDRLPLHYKKYLMNAFCKYFELVGIPLKLEYKNSINPYEVKE